MTLSFEAVSAAAGLAGRDLDCAYAVGSSGGKDTLTAQASASSRDSESRPARFVVRPLVMSPTAEVQESPIAIPPSKQRNEACQLCFYARVGPRDGLGAAGKA
jgi:hypothetical protein